jgi:Tfp pilus assembly protein PilF
MRISLRFLALVAVAASASCTACGGNGQADKRKSFNRLELAKEMLGQRNFDGAEVEANKAVAFHKGNEEAHNVLGLIDLYRAANVVDLVERDDCLTGVDAEALREEADEHLVNADAHFARASELAPDFGEPLANRGVVAYLLEKYDDAAQYLTKALALPHRLQSIGIVRANLGWAHFLDEDYVSAAKELRQADQFQPGLCLTSYRLGRVYFARKEWEKALSKFQGVTADNCPIQEAHLYLMKTYVELGESDKVEQAHEDCAALFPNSCVASQCRSIDRDQ